MGAADQVPLGDVLRDSQILAGWFGVIALPYLLVAWRFRVGFGELMRTCVGVWRYICVCEDDTSRYFEPALLVRLLIKSGHRHALCNPSLAASLNYQFQNADCPRKVEMWKSQDTG